MDNYIHSGCSSLRGQKCLLRNLKFGPHRFLTSQKTMKALFLWQFQSPNRLVFSVYILDSLKPPGIFSSQKSPGKTTCKITSQGPKSPSAPGCRCSTAVFRKLCARAKSCGKPSSGSFFGVFPSLVLENSTNLWKNSQKKWFVYNAPECLAAKFSWCWVSGGVWGKIDLAIVQLKSYPEATHIVKQKAAKKILWKKKTFLGELGRIHMFSAEHMFFSKRLHVEKTLLCRKQINSTVPQIVENSWKIVEKITCLARLPGNHVTFTLGP